MPIAPSARRHGITDDQMRHAFAHFTRFHELDDEMVMFVGPDITGRLLEIGVAGGAIVHAMKARDKFL